jgi:predicted ribosomally synthesized peptide with nif11-like leader
LIKSKAESKYTTLRRRKSIMSRQNVLDFLEKGSDDKQFRIKYDNTMDINKFVELAKEDGFEFTVEELKGVLFENGDSFDSLGNPPKKDIW